MGRFNVLLVGVATAALTMLAVASAQMVPVGGFVQGSTAAPCTIACTYAFAPWYDTARSYSAAYAAPGTNPALLLDRFNSSGTFQDQCTLLVYTDGTVDLTHSTGCPGGQTVDQWGAGRLTVGDIIKVNTFYDMSQSGVCSGSCDMVAVSQTNAGELRFGWGSDGFCYVAAIPCAVATSITTQEYRSAGNYTPSSPLAFTTVGGEATGTVQRWIQCGGWISSSDLPNSEMSSATDSWQINNGASVSITAGILHAANSTGNPPGGTNNVDGSENTTASFVFNATVAKVRLAGRAGQSGKFVFEEGGCSNFNSTAIRNALRLNEKAFYGTP